MPVFIENLKKTERGDRNTMVFVAKLIEKMGKTYWMHELRTVIPYSLNDRIERKGELN